MTATQLLTGRGGWPNSVFLTPDLEPFFAGTYFAIEDQAGRPGFRTVLNGLGEAWANRRPEVEQRAEQVARAVRRLLGERRQPAAELPGRELAEKAAAALKGRYDADWGGFGAAPKFPSPGNLILLQHLAAGGDTEAGEMVGATLAKMGRGAIYDQLGGGFHRYTLDRAWRIPHFEKMLYDNAHLAELLVESWRATGAAELERLARGTLDFVLAEMTLADGAFKSAIDAETDGDEGAYYVWSAAELRRELGDEGFALLAPILGFAGEPNFERDRHTLYLPEPLEAQDERLGVGPPALLERLEPQLDRLRAARRRRPFPLVDDKVLTDWNGMMIGAMARAGAILEEPRYLEAAVRAARFVLARLRAPDGSLLHVWSQGGARIPAFVDDYAFLIRGLLALAEATADEAWLGHAARLADEAERRLGDERGGYYQAAERPDLLVRSKVATDGATPSGNAVMLLNLLELSERTGRRAYRERAERGLRAFAPDLELYGAGAPVLAMAVLRAGAAPAADGLPSPAEEARRRVAASARFTAGGAPWRPFEVRLEIAPGWHVNANPASSEFLIPTEVAGQVRSVRYPPGELVRLAFADDELAVYTGEVVLTAEAAAIATAVGLTYQACNDRRCLPPVSLELPVSGAEP